MKTEITSMCKDLEVVEFAFREKYCYSEEDKKVLRNHFEATIKDTRTWYEDICCVIKYYSDDGKFLGFDESSIWCRQKSGTRNISMQSIFPEGAVKAQIIISAPKAVILSKKEAIHAVGLIVFIATMIWLGIRVSH